MKTSLILSLVCAGLLVGCTSTVTPDIVVAAQASNSGNQRNSGLLDRTLAGWVVDESFRARYNALIDDYGDNFIVPLKHDAGLLPRGDGTWLMDFQHFDQMAKMNTWRAMGKPH